MDRASLSKPLNQALLVSNFSSEACLLLSVFIELKSTRALFALDKALVRGTVVTGLIFYPDH